MNFIVVLLKNVPINEVNFADVTFGISLEFVIVVAMLGQIYFIEEKIFTLKTMKPFQVVQHDWFVWMIHDIMNLDANSILEFKVTIVTFGIGMFLIHMPIMLFS